MLMSLTDDIGMPRFWAAVWVLFVGGSLVSSTLRAQLKDIEALYRHAESTRAIGALDDAIGRLEMPLIEEMLEAYSMELRSLSNGATMPGHRWRHCLAFVKDICERIARTPALTAQFEDLRLHMERLDRLFGNFHQRQKPKNTYIRALPATVLEELYTAVVPGSPTNPFKSDAAQWRVYAAFSLLLHQGLRRGEALILPVDFLKSELVAASDTRKYWLNVRTNEYEDYDTRYSVPSIKTAESIRQIPVTSTTATALLTYSENYRGKPDHSFFLSSARGLALSAEGVNYFLKCLTNKLSKHAMQVLADRTGMISVSPHDLRHTAAVIRLKQLKSLGTPLEDALSLMRRYFGWSPESIMPVHYAKAAFEERLDTVWRDEFDERAALLLALPQ